ncbi:MAG: hypothetical protein GX071_14060 [Gammaproteobacteria bacterium]|nr:hypothetical protein [Gammaproteobacteria bacterium]
MRIVRPVPVLESNLISSTVPEDDHPQWVSGTTYTIGALVIRGHRIWEALLESTDADPLLDDPTEPKWLDTGATNRWRMFDEKVGSTTDSDDPITVVIDPRAVVNAIAMFNLLARAVTLTMTDPVDGTIYDHVVRMVDTGAADWYDYFLTPFERMTDFVLDDVPSYGSARLTITIDNAGAPVAVGHMAIGVLRDIGVALYGTSVGIIDYSRKEFDEFGTPIIVQRAFSKRAEFDVFVETENLSRVQRMLSSIRATPVVWIGEKSIEATVLFGFYRDFSISINGPTQSEATITVEGLT